MLGGVSKNSENFEISNVLNFQKVPNLHISGLRYAISFIFGLLDREKLHMVCQFDRCVSEIGAILCSVLFFVVA